MWEEALMRNMLTAALMTLALVAVGHTQDSNTAQKGEVDRLRRVR